MRLLACWESFFTSGVFVGYFFLIVQHFPLKVKLCRRLLSSITTNNRDLKISFFWLRVHVISFNLIAFNVSISMGALLLALAKYTSGVVIYLTEEIQWTYWLNDRAIQHFSAMNQCDSQETDHLREDCLFCPFSQMKITS